MVKKLTLISLIFTMFLSQQVLSAEGDTYSFTWLDPDKEVYVLQNRKFRKKGKFHVSLGGGMTTSGSFVNGSNLQGRAGYFFKEEWGFELLYSKNAGEENADAQAVRNTTAAGSTPFRQITNYYMGAMLLWSPFYTKINTFNTIVYMDYIFGIGIGKIEETNNRLELQNTVNKTETVEAHNALLWSMGMKFYVNDSFSIRPDFTGVMFKSLRPDRNEENVYSHYDLSLSVVMDL
jgi:outer membrane beta-barrel protein